MILAQGYLGSPVTQGMEWCLGFEPRTFVYVDYGSSEWMMSLPLMTSACCVTNVDNHKRSPLTPRITTARSGPARLSH